MNYIDQLIERYPSLNVCKKDIEDAANALIESFKNGGKLLGAGGGGFLLFYVPFEKQEAVKDALKDQMYVPFKFENDGTKVIYYGPDEYEN